MRRLRDELEAQPETMSSLKPQRMSRLKMLEVLLDVSRRLTTFETLDDVLHALVEMTSNQLDTERGSLFLNDPACNELYSRVAQGNISARSAS